LKDFYFKKFEKRQPYKPVPVNEFRTLVFRFFAIITIALGLAYLHWRWTASLNYNALWFALPLVIAETLSFAGTVLMIFNFWGDNDPEIKEPPHMLSEVEELNGRIDRPISIDVFITTYNEEVELVRYSIADAKKIQYPFKDVSIKIFVLDDGRRDGSNPTLENMKQVAIEEGVGYMTRDSNEGYKAGNLKNGLEQTEGDFFVILDADARSFKSFLKNTLGYFRDKKVAWVQTPQWFYDTTEHIPLSQKLINTFRIKSFFLKRTIYKLFGKIKSGVDVFGNDPRLFYEVILKKRNYYNAAFCCGAGSVHRREAVMKKAVKDFAKQVSGQVDDVIQKAAEKVSIANLSVNIFAKLEHDYFLNHDIKPFKFHASEDIYTSMMMHNDSEGWKSIQHPIVECKMLSPQDLDSCMKQRTRYASGSLDIAFKDNPLLLKGLSIGQKICYLNTIWSYFAPIWLLIFLVSPIVFFFSHSLPVAAYSFDFFKFFIPFQLANVLMFTIASWGINTTRGDQYYISNFWLMLKSLFSAVKGEKVKFNVTPKDKRNSVNNLVHIWPHITIISLTVIGIIYNIILIMHNQHPSVSGFASNTFWSFFNIYNLSIIIRAAYWSEPYIKHDISVAPEVAIQVDERRLKVA